LRLIRLLCAGLLLASCDHFPSNPVEKADGRLVRIDHLGTRYVPIDPPADGLVARKLNILEFRVRVENLETAGLEFRGKAELAGPPETKDHAFRFRTDRLDPVVPEAGVPFEVFTSIDTGRTYTFFRFQIPMNEYSPFTDGRGMVTGLTIDEVFSVDGRGALASVPFSLGETGP
jgi:hypothetical protein